MAAVAHSSACAVCVGASMHQGLPDCWVCCSQATVQRVGQGGSTGQHLPRPCRVQHSVSDGPERSGGHATIIRSGVSRWCRHRLSRRGSGRRVEGSEARSAGAWGRAWGVKRPEGVGCCLKKAILVGHVDISTWQRLAAEQMLKLSLSAVTRLGSGSPMHLLSGDVLGMVARHLEDDRRKDAVWRAMVARSDSQEHPSHQVLVEDDCPVCGRSKRVRIKEVLHLHDYAGMDYEDGGQDAAVQCGSKCNGIYVAGICEGQPSVDCGKFHNHCTECPLFGVCIYDYREAHCGQCGNHWFAGMSGFPGSSCGGKTPKPAGDTLPASWDEGIAGL